MWIENAAASDITTGFHHDAGPNSMLIQIMDPASDWWPKPRYEFKESHRFEFLDAEDEDGFPDEAKISHAQAEQIVALLQHALDNHMNVVVHCMAGLCRSGAVAEVGIAMGFQDTERLRIPNTRVKKRLMQALQTHYNTRYERLYAKGSES
jgi:predicted protein tyrosine phosphatase